MQLKTTLKELQLEEQMLNKSLDASTQLTTSLQETGSDKSSKSLEITSQMATSSPETDKSVSSQAMRSDMDCSSQDLFKDL